MNTETITDGDRLKVLRLADQAVKSLDAEINNWPKALVWACSSREEISQLRQHFEGCIEDWVKRLPMTETEEGRELLLELIESADRELKAIEEIRKLIN